ncbi:trypsin-like serine protease-like protein [Drosophila innubila nudivirus]|uniref:Trypsin-like serine protease-like protein n=1 Tax=Drosophila innubila nudivirus TaxID=2057187 RepID=A0A2H4UX84_9VIRU|nr:trypsin-like serine protease-like protein [Drosophila innubila nudivirus]ATZ81524.1 trypsin-like serine protease-like protein [Drosophila innubila nudivirus]
MLKIDNKLVTFVIFCSLGLPVFGKFASKLSYIKSNNENYLDFPLNAKYDSDYEDIVKNNINIEYLDYDDNDNNNRGDKIFNGKPAITGMFPSQAQLIIKLDDERAFQCGGSLVDRHWVLTSASCLIFSSNIKWIVVVLGTHLLDSSSRTLTNATNIVINSKYFDIPDNPNDDLALVRVNGVRFTKEVQPVVLKAKDENYIGKCAYVTGYGDVGLAQSEHKLYYGTVLMAAPDACFDTKDGAKTLLCAKTSKLSSTCPGDEGSPLYLRDDDGDWEQIGIALYRTVNSCEDLNPIPFTNVQLYVKWIYETIDKYTSNDPKTWSF